MNEIQIAAFWSKVDITDNPHECWNWLGAKKPAGYGNVRINLQYKLAHRVAFELVNCPIPDCLMVCHICDNPSCCNPNHLMLGTTRSNAADMLIKGRAKKPEQAARGINNSNAKFCDEDIVSIRRIYKAGILNQYQIAAQYKVSQATIGAIIRQETWRHV